MLRSIFSTATFQQSQITILGTIINGFLGLLFYIFMARFLGPSNFGLLTVCITTLTLIADIADFGTNAGIVRFVAAHLNSNRDKAFKFLKLGLEIKLFVWFLVLIIGYFLSPFIASSIFNKPELSFPLRLTMIGVGGAMLFSFATSSLQAFQRYFSWSVLNITTNFLRLVVILLLFYSQQLNLTNGIISYIALPFFGFSLALLFLPTKQFLSAKNEISVSNQFFKFNRWIALFTIIAAISSRLDTFLNARLLTFEEIGIYGAANQLVQVIPQIVGALGIVAAPKFASFQNNSQMLTYFKKLQFMVLGLGVLIMIVIPLSFYFIPVIFGITYLASVLPFVILLLAMIVFLVALPLHTSIIYYFGRSDIFVWISVIHLLITGLGGFLLISNYGILGTALTVFIGMLANLLLPLVWFLIKIRR